MTKIPNTDNFTFGTWDLEFGAYLLFGICYLEFVPNDLYLRIPLLIKSLS